MVPLLSPSFFCFCPVDEWVLCWFIRALISCLTFQWALPYTIATVIGPVSFTTLLTAWNKGPPCCLCWDLLMEPLGPPRLNLIPFIFVICKVCLNSSFPQTSTLWRVYSLFPPSILCSTLLRFQNTCVWALALWNYHWHSISGISRGLADAGNHWGKGNKIGWRSIIWWSLCLCGKKSFVVGPIWVRISTLPISNLGKVTLLHWNPISSLIKSRFTIVSCYHD